MSDWHTVRRWFGGRAAREMVMGVLVAIVATAAPAAAQPDSSDRYILPPPSVQALFDRDKNLASLDRVSPDGRHFLIQRSDELSSLDLMARRTLRLAMLELVPEVDREWRLATYGTRGLDIYSLGERRRWSIDLPEEAFVSDAIWSPDGSQLAFLAHLPDSTQVWTADVATGETRALSDARVMATLAARPAFGAPRVPSRMLQWTPDGAVLALLVPAGRGPEPPVSDVPTGPVVRRSREKATPTRTLPFLLRTEHDAELFRHYATAQLARLSPGRAPVPIGEPAMYMSIALSPDGRHILREQLVEPFSFIVGYTSFGRTLDVLALNGDVVSTIRELPLHEPAGRDNRPDADLPREVAWRPDGQGLSFLWREPRPGDAGEAREADDAGEEDDRGDRLMTLTVTLAAPVTMASARLLVSSEGRLSSLRWSSDGRYAFAEREQDDEREIVAYDLSAAVAVPHVLASHDPDAVLDLPGELMTRQTGNGVTSVVSSTDGEFVYLQGPGFSEAFTPQPFLDRVAIASGVTTRVFEGSAEAFDRPLVPLDDDVTRMIVSRETKAAPPDSYLWTADGTWERYNRKLCLRL